MRKILLLFLAWLSASYAIVIDENRNRSQSLP